MTKLFKITAVTVTTLILGVVVSGCIKKPTPQPTVNTNQNVNAVATTTAEIDTTNWKTYRNEQYGFEFKYPKTWVYVSENSGSIKLKDNEYEYYLEGVATYPVTINIIKVENNFSIDKWITDLTKTKNSRDGWVKEISICCGSRAIKSFDYLGVETTILKDDVMYRVGLKNLGEQQVNQKVQAVYDGLLQTWEFIN